MSRIFQIHERVTVPSCMGGWCEKRERCVHYHRRTARSPAERFCARDGDQCFRPLEASMPAMSEAGDLPS